MNHFKYQKFTITSSGLVNFKRGFGWGLYLQWFISGTKKDFGRATATMKEISL